MLKLFGNSKEKITPKVLTNPFGKSNITCIAVFIRKSPFRDEWSASGSVDFQNQNTQGSQRFEGDSFDDVVSKIKTFIDSEVK